MASHISARRRLFVFEKVGEALSAITDSLEGDPVAAQLGGQGVQDLGLAQIYLDEAVEAAKSSDGGHDGHDTLLVGARKEVRRAVEHLALAQAALELWEAKEGI